MWQPIETAPKTDVSMMGAVPILGYCPRECADERVRVIWWEPTLGGGMWYDDRDIKGIVKPTHWMPLPAPPTDKTEKAALPLPDQPRDAGIG